MPMRHDGTHAKFATGQSGREYIIFYHPETHWHAFIKGRDPVLRKPILVRVPCKDVARDCGVSFGKKNPNTHTYMKELWNNVLY